MAVLWPRCGGAVAVLCKRVVAVVAVVTEIGLEHGVLYTILVALPRLPHCHNPTDSMVIVL